MPTDKQSFLAELQSRLVELVRTSPAADIERNVKALLAQAFQRLELVTRDEFDVTTKLLEQLGERVVALEDAVAALERGGAERAGAPDDGSAG
jgi:BMFP domain-containing protein YqiC